MREATDGESLDTLSIFMKIFSLLIYIALVICTAVATALTLIFFKRLPLKLRGVLPRITATAFVFTLMSANCQQYLDVVTLCWARLCSVICGLYGISAWVLFIAILLCKAMPHDKSEGVKALLCNVYFNFSKRKISRASGIASSSFL